MSSEKQRMQPDGRVDSLRPEGGLMAADLDRLTWLPTHAELIDGGLFLRAPHPRFHIAATSVLEAALQESIPDHYLLARDVPVVVGPRHRLVPDLVVLQSSASTERQASWYPAEMVRLVVEVVSAESLGRDRERKPQLYADAQILHFWRVESEPGVGGQLRPVVYQYELEQALPGYVLTGTHHGRFESQIPYPVSADLREID